jgi:flagellum-specific peptidoglycan hydrolase FlgJ
MNFSANLLIEDMLGAEQLSYKPRKKKRDPNSLSLSQKLSNSIGNLFGIKSSSEEKLQKPKPKTREQIDMEQMDQFWTDFDYELPDQKPMVLPSSSKKTGDSKNVSKSTDNIAIDNKKERMNQSMGDLSSSSKGGSRNGESEMSRNSSVGKMDKSRPNSASLNGVDDAKQKQNRSPLREAITAGDEEEKDFVQQIEQEFTKLGSQQKLNAPSSESNSIDKDRVLAQ